MSKEKKTIKTNSHAPLSGVSGSLKPLSVEIPLRGYLEAGYRVNIGDRVNLKYWLRTFFDDDYRTVTIEDVDARNNIEYCGEEHYICLEVLPKAVFNFR